MSDLELLSHLLDGDLPPDEAAALHARIAREPELARQWKRMGALPGRLEQIGLQDAGPPEVVALQDRRRPTVWPWVAGVTALAAAALLAVRFAPTPTPMVTAPSEPDILAAANRVECSGDAVFVFDEPTDADPTLTVSVRAGQASVRLDGDDEPVVLGPGTLRRFQLVGLDEPEATDDAELQRLRRRVRELEDELDAARFERELLRGQLAGVSGDPQPWPADLPPAIAASGAEETLRAALDGLEGHELLELDCEEYPCVATLRSPSDGQKIREAFLAVQRSVTERAGPNAFVYTISEDSHEETSRLVTSLILLGDRTIDRELDTRLEYRTDPMRKEWLWPQE